MDDLQPRGKHADYIHLLFTSEHHFHLKQFFEQLSQVKGVTPPQNTHSVHHDLRFHTFFFLDFHIIAFLPWY